jgi:DNA-binding NarL/FixJ family response regulator
MKTATRLKILCVDDSPRLTAAFVKLIALQPDMEPVGVLHRADGLVAEAAQRRPDIVLLDLTMEGQDPIAALAEMTDRDDHVRVIVFSGVSDERLIEEAMNAGAWGYVDKAQDPGRVLDAIRRVGAGEVVLPWQDL